MAAETLRNAALRYRAAGLCALPARWHVLLTLIETRGEGGLFLCAPTPGYELIQGDLAEPPVLSAAERETLLEAAWALNQY